MRRDKTNYVIQSVANSLDVLEQFSGDADELGVSDLSKRLKLHKNNVFRLLATLESRGYIEQNKVTENYRLGTKCLQLGQAYLKHTGLLRQARPIMESVVAQCRETAFVAVLRRNTVVPLDSVEADQPVRIIPHVGEILPLHCTAVGKACLAFESEEELAHILAAGLMQHTERTITDRQTLVQHLKVTAERGYAVDLGEYLEDVHSVAVPIRDYTRHVVGSLAVSGPAYRLEAERVEREIAPLIVRAGNELSSRLGYDG